jgi:penicillin-binding protein 2
MDRQISTKRLSLLAVVSLALVATLGARLYYLQVMAAPTFEQMASGNRTRVVFDEAPRGRILDVHGRVLVDRRESLVVTVDRTVVRSLPRAEVDRVFTALALELTRTGFKTKVEDLWDRLSNPRYSELKPVPVAEDVDVELWTVLAERDLPGVQVERRWVRHYPYGPLAAHVLGYVGTANQEELDTAAALRVTKPYQPGDEIGKAGIEAVYEQVLRGTPEVRVVEINARGDVIGTVEVLQEAQPGDDVVLTIDVDAQHLAEHLVRTGLEEARQRPPRRDSPPNASPAGSMVVIDPTTGGLVAVASYPTFDPRDLVFGISQAQADYLFRSAERPFVNRATSGEYPAASTFKPFVALAALQAGVIGQWDTIIDRGSYQIERCLDTETGGCVFRNAGGTAYGKVDLRRSLIVSSSVYYYRIGDLFWTYSDRYGRTGIQDMAARFGFGEALGFDLPTESAGYLPTPESKAERHHLNPTAFPEGSWRTGDNVNLSIGHGDVSVTPLQLANAYATLVNGGTVHAPRLVAEIRDGRTGEVKEAFGPQVVRQLDLDPSWLSAIVESLLRVPVDGSDQRGTAATAFRGFPLDQFPVGGKTGTAQVGGGRADNAMFAAFGPWPQPRYVVAAVFEESGFGGDAAAPAVRRLFEALGGIVPMPPAPLAPDAHHFTWDAVAAGPATVAAPVQAPTTTPPPPTNAPPAAATPAPPPPTRAPDPTPTPAPTAAPPPTEPPTTPAPPPPEDPGPDPGEEAG